MQPAAWCASIGEVSTSVSMTGEGRASTSSTERARASGANVLSIDRLVQAGRIVAAEARREGEQANVRIEILGRVLRAGDPAERPLDRRAETGDGPHVEREGDPRPGAAVEERAEVIEGTFGHGLSWRRGSEEEKESGRIWAKHPPGRPGLLDRNSCFVGTGPCRGDCGASAPIARTDTSPDAQRRSAGGRVGRLRSRRRWCGWGSRCRRSSGAWARYRR